MQITNKSRIDFFKVFKIFDTKKLQKQGDVKLVYNKEMGKKVLSAEGSISIKNFIVFESAQALKAEPQLSFSQKYLYIVCCYDLSKQLCFQLTLNINTKYYKVNYSTVFKEQKKTSKNIFQIPLQVKSSQWSIVVIDLFDLCQKLVDKKQTKMIFSLSAVQIRSSSMIKNMYLSDNLYDARCLPKDMQLPLRQNEEFFTKYNYVLLGDRQKESLLLQDTFSEIKTMKTGRQSENNNKFEAFSQQKNNFSIKKQRSNSKESKRCEKSLEKGKHNQSKSFSLQNRSGIKKRKDSKDMSKFIQQSFFEQGLNNEAQMILNKLPKPQVTINVNYLSIQGKTISRKGFVTLGAFFIKPSIFAVHKFITHMCPNNQIAHKVAVGYEDGSICIWDVYRKKSLHYMKTELVQLIQIEYKGKDQEQMIIIVGKDRMKRQVLLIINTTQVLFKQISNYSIKGFISSEEVIVSFGYENIRLWKLNRKNNIITGVGLYLGKMNRNITYNSACEIEQGFILVSDDNGYITNVQLKTQKMVWMKRVCQNSIDLILNMKQTNTLIIAESTGTIKLLSYNLQVVEQFELGIRAKNISYQILRGQVILDIEHVNNTLATLNVSHSQYKYSIRQHSEQIVSLKYNQKLSKIVSISKDNTIRIWSLSKCPQQKYVPQLQYNMKQEYQFFVNSNEIMISLCLDRNKFAYVGFTKGIVRKLDTVTFMIVNQNKFLFQEDIANQKNLVRVQKIDTSPNCKFVLISLKTTNKSYVVLANSDLQILTKFNPPFNIQSKSNITDLDVKAVFNLTLKKFCIFWPKQSTNQIQICSLQNGQEGKKLFSFSIDIKLKEITYRDEFIFINGKSNTNDMYFTYEDKSGQIIKALNLSCQCNYYNIFGELLLYNNNKNQLVVNLLETTNHQAIDLPEPVSNFQLCNSSLIVGKKVLICSGDRTHALYAIQCEIKNYSQNNIKAKEYEKRENKITEGMNFAPNDLITISKIVQIQQKNIDDEEQMECIQSKHIQIHQNISEDLYQQKRNYETAKKYKEPQNQETMIKYENYQNKNRQSKPKLLKSIYEQQQQMYEACKEHINYQVQQNQIQKIESSNMNRIIQNSDRKIQLMYGWNNNYSSKQKNGHRPLRLIWQPKSTSAIFLHQNNIILHYFTNPIHQKIVTFPNEPDYLLEIGNSIGVIFNKQLKIYSQQMQYVNCVTASGETIKSVSGSNCLGYFLILSTNKTLSKTYIQIADAVTFRVICSTYMKFIISNATISVNPFQQCLEFIVVTEQQLYFYRMTSILTLQVQELQNLDKIVNMGGIGEILCSTFIKLNSQELILLGVTNGSVIVIDSRANQVLVVCSNVCKSGILDILSLQSENQKLFLAFVNDNNSIGVMNLQNKSLSGLVQQFQRKSMNYMSADSDIQIHSKIKQCGNKSLGILLMSKFGVLWLFDLIGGDTLKILTVHKRNNDKSDSLITKAIIQGQFQQETIVLTCGSDGTIKQTSLSNLEQINQIYKPRRVVQDFVIENNMMVVGFGSEIFFYQNLTEKNVIQKGQWKFIGSINLSVQTKKQKNCDQKIVSIRAIKFSDNYVICTSSNLFIVHYSKILSAQTNKLKVQIQQICNNLEFAQKIEVHGFDHILVKQRQKICVWFRKNKRGVSPIEELSKVSQLTYYMIDMYQIKSSDVIFTTQLKGKQPQPDEYLVCSRQKSMLIWRNFKQHSINKQVQINTPPIRCVNVNGDGDFIVGDQYGTVWLIKQNGYILSKVTVFNSPVLGVGHSQKGKYFAYGPNFVIFNF